MSSLENQLLVVQKIDNSIPFVQLQGLCRLSGYFSNLLDFGFHPIERNDLYFLCIVAGVPELFNQAIKEVILFQKVEVLLTKNFDLP